MKFRDQPWDTKTDDGIVKKKLTEEIRSNQIFAEGCMIAKKERKDKGGGEWSSW